MRRSILVFVLAVLVVFTLTGCAQKDTGKKSVESSHASSQTKKSAESSFAGSQTKKTETDVTPVEAGKAITALSSLTARENEGMALAASDTGRKWANGNPDGSLGLANGDPFLAGYQIMLTDKKTIYIVTVFDGVVYPASFGSPKDLKDDNYAISFPYSPDQDYSVTVEGANQTAAFEAAKAEVAKYNPDATQGGVADFMYSFAGDKNGNYAMVAIFANKDIGEFSMGGQTVRE